MDAMNMVLETPSWAYDFCYYYAFVAAIVVVTSVYSLVQLFMLPALAKKFLPMTSLTVSLILSAIVSVVLTMMQFWICRGALKTKENFAAKANAKAVEKFAANCQSGEDCTAIMGTPQPNYAVCGDRKKCGGYVMQNNMEPAVGSDLAGLPGF
jgi:hypothetical protein